jgi:hypothetical protein
MTKESDLDKVQNLIVRRALQRRCGNDFVFNHGECSLDRFLCDWHTEQNHTEQRNPSRKYQEQYSEHNDCKKDCLGYI